MPKRLIQFQIVSLICIAVAVVLIFVWPENPKFRLAEILEKKIVVRVSSIKGINELNVSVMGNGAIRVDFTADSDVAAAKAVKIIEEFAKFEGGNLMIYGNIFINGRKGKFIIQNGILELLSIEPSRQVLGTEKSVGYVLISRRIATPVCMRRRMALLWCGSP